MYHNGHLVWYAILRDNEDNDYCTGTFVKRDALRMARRYRKDGYPEAHIAMIDPDDGFCIDEIRDF